MSMLLVANSTTLAPVKGALHVLAGAAAKARPGLDRPIVELNIWGPGAPGTAPPLHISSEKSKPRLPPELIQKTLRQNYPKFRVCYEQGLGRDAHLQGRVTVKLVIGRDGTVTSANQADGTTMPDVRVIECVLQEYRQVVFPKPEGGTVTVIYPIAFSPE
jgi:hypothetical protein